MLRLQPKTKGTVSVAGAVNETELWLKAVAPGRQRNRHREVTCAGVEVGRKGFADPLDRASAFGKGNDVIRSTGLVTHYAYDKRQNSI